MNKTNYWISTLTELPAVNTDVELLQEDGSVITARCNETQVNTRYWYTEGHTRPLYTYKFWRAV